MVTAEWTERPADSRPSLYWSRANLQIAAAIVKSPPPPAPESTVTVWRCLLVSYGGTLGQCAKIFQMCNTPLQNNSNLQHTPSEYFKCATHPFTVFQMCSTPLQNISNVQHTAKNFQTCSTLRQTFKCATHCGNNCRAEHRIRIRLRCTRTGWPEICLSGSTRLSLCH